MTRFHLITFFEEACDAYLNASILGRARRDKKITVTYQNPRNFVPIAKDKSPEGAYKKVDDRPYGGGPGMVVQALPVIRAVEKALRGKVQGASGKGQAKLKTYTLPLKPRAVVVWFTPSGKQFTNKDADALAKKYTDIVLVCGRYEGIDERAKKILKTLAPIKEFAVGEAVYTGGELPAMAIVDAVTRRLPGVLGKDASIEERRIASSAVYTRPETISYKNKRYKVPTILRTGHHAKMDEWRSKRRSQA